MQPFRVHDLFEFMTTRHCLPTVVYFTAGVGTLELECRPQRAKDVMKAMFVAMRFGLG